MKYIASIAIFLGIIGATSNVFAGGYWYYPTGVYFQTPLIQTYLAYHPERPVIFPVATTSVPVKCPVGFTCTKVR